MKPSTTKPSTAHVFGRTSALLVFATLILPLLLAAPARVDERDDIIRDIESRLRDVRGYISQLTGASSTSNVDYATDKADSIKSKISDLDRVKGDDSKASEMVSKYPGYVDKFKEAMQSLKRIKEEQLAFTKSDQLRVCKDAEGEIKSKVADFLRSAPDKEDYKALQGVAENIANPIREFIRSIKKVPDTLEPLISKAKEFNITDGEWSGVSSEMSKSADEIYKSWTKDVADAREICNKVALGARYDDVVKAAFGNCTESEYGTYREQIENFCKDLDKRECDGNQLCPEVRERLRRNTECFKARQLEMDKCFNGGGPKHKKELEEAQTAIDKCNARLNDCKENE